MTAEVNLEISELYLFQMVTAEWGSQPAIGIQTRTPVAPGKKNELVAKVGEPVQLKLVKGQSLDFVVLDGKLGRSVRDHGLLIFRRS